MKNMKSTHIVLTNHKMSYTEENHNNKKKNILKRFNL